MILVSTLSSSEVLVAAQYLADIDTLGNGLASAEYADTTIRVGTRIVWLDSQLRPDTDARFKPEVAW